MYKLYIKEPDDIKGNKVGEYSFIEDVRDDVRDLLEGLPEGTQAYVYRQSVDEEGNEWGPIRPAEAYQVIDGRIKTIWTRYKGGEWPIVWTPNWWAEKLYILEPEKNIEGAPGFEDVSERLMAKAMLRKIGVPNREISKIIYKTPKDYWKKSKEEFLKLGPRTYELVGESKKAREERLDKILRDFEKEK